VEVAGSTAQKIIVWQTVEDEGRMNLAINTVSEFAEHINK
jgi:hypothetical protein